MVQLVLNGIENGSLADVIGHYLEFFVPKKDKTL